MTCKYPYLYPCVPIPTSPGMGFMRVWVRVDIESPVGYLWWALAGTPNNKNQQIVELCSDEGPNVVWEQEYLPTRLCRSVPSSISSSHRPAPVWPNDLLNSQYFCLSLEDTSWHAHKWNCIHTPGCDSPQISHTYLDPRHSDPSPLDCSQRWPLQSFNSKPFWMFSPFAYASLLLRHLAHYQRKGIYDCWHCSSATWWCSPCDCSFHRKSWFLLGQYYNQQKLHLKVY